MGESYDGSEMVCLDHLARLICNFANSYAYPTAAGITSKPV